MANRSPHLELRPLQIRSLDGELLAGREAEEERGRSSRAHSGLFVLFLFKLLYINVTHRYCLNYFLSLTIMNYCVHVCMCACVCACVCMYMRQNFGMGTRMLVATTSWDTSTPKGHLKRLLQQWSSIRQACGRICLAC